MLPEFTLNGLHLSKLDVFLFLWVVTRFRHLFPYTIKYGELFLYALPPDGYGSYTDMLSLNVYSPNYTKTFSTSRLLQTRKWKSWHHISVRKLTYPISGTSSSMIISFKSSCRLAIRERWVTSSRIFTKKGNIWSNKQTCRTTNKQTKNV